MKAVEKKGIQERRAIELEGKGRRRAEAEHEGLGRIKLFEDQRLSLNQSHLQFCRWVRMHHNPSWECIAHLCNHFLSRIKPLLNAGFPIWVSMVKKKVYGVFNCSSLNTMLWLINVMPSPVHFFSLQHWFNFSAQLAYYTVSNFNLNWFVELLVGALLVYSQCPQSTTLLPLFLNHFWTPCLLEMGNHSINFPMLEVLEDQTRTQTWH